MRTSLLSYSVSNHISSSLGDRGDKVDSFRRTAGSAAIVLPEKCNHQKKRSDGLRQCGSEGEMGIFYITLFSFFFAANNGFAYCLLLLLLLPLGP